MYETDTAPAQHPLYEKAVFDVSVPRLYVSAVRVCARRNPERHGDWIKGLARAERALPAHCFDAATTAAADALRNHIRAYVANNEDVADEAAALMDRLVATLTARGAQIIARDPTTVRCTRWWQRRQDWLDGATTLGRPGGSQSLVGFLFGHDYAASVHLLRGSHAAPFAVPSSFGTYPA
ncbi:hypothetical protein [Pandoravirus japonicus]|uniref:Uncharacterized protein n=1 Tax=Pandoravirus japonicus TaxID=2823154 RepID=A0A811BRD9_9VIRU|nr:hypothetical protein [Pandoravirus japonicus]